MLARSIAVLVLYPRVVNAARLGGTRWETLEGACPSPAPAARGAIRLEKETIVSDVDDLLNPTSVEELRDYEPVLDPSATTRVGPLERSTLIPNGALTSLQLTPEFEYLLTLRGSTGQSLQARIPHQTYVGSASPSNAARSAARSAIDNASVTTTTTKCASWPVRVIGIGYYPTTTGGTSSVTTVELGPATAATLSWSGVQLMLESSSLLRGDDFRSQVSRDEERSLYQLALVA